MRSRLLRQMQWPLSYFIGPVKHINPEIINTSVCTSPVNKSAFLPPEEELDEVFLGQLIQHSCCWSGMG